MKSIGEKVRIQRVTKGFSQEYMAFMLDISQAAYSNLERGDTEMTIRRIYEIAEIFEISPYELMPPPKFGSGIYYHRIAAVLSGWLNRFRTPSGQGKISRPAI